jgi:hypothetical protein
METFFYQVSMLHYSTCVITNCVSVDFLKLFFHQWYSTVHTDKNIYRDYTASSRAISDFTTKP